MKKINIITIGLLIGLYVFIMCKPEEPIEPTNQPPVAKAGKDTTITLESCSSTGAIMLDGTASFDPDNNFAFKYSWAILSSPANSQLITTGMQTAGPMISNLTAGKYDFLLVVADLGGLSAKDTVTVNVIGSTIKEYDFDMSITNPFQFVNNYTDCYYNYFYYGPCSYYDFTQIDERGTFLPLGGIKFYCYEQADTATTSSIHTTNFGLYTSGNTFSVNGTSSVNFKQVYQMGGGPFNGTFTPVKGSALGCDPNIFKNLTPLAVAGTMDTTSRSVTLSIRGKIYF